MSTPSLLNIPYLYKAGTLYSQIPESGAGDFTVTRTTTPTAGRSTRVNKDGLIELVADNVPRIDYPLGGAVNGCPALLVEPSAQNLCLQSENFGTTWSPNQLIAFGSGSVLNTTGTLDPYGTNVSDLIVASTVSGVQHRIDQTTTSASGSYTFSVFVKAAGYNFTWLRIGTVGAFFNLSNGAITGTSAGIVASSQNYGNGWYRCIISKASSSANEVLRINIIQTDGVTDFAGDGTSGIYVFGAQYETGTVATSYIPTTTAAVTRGAEVVEKTGISSLLGQTSGTFYLDASYTTKGNTTATFWAYIQGTPTTNNIGLAVSANTVRSVVNSQSDILLTPSTVSGVKIAWAYDGSGVVCFVNGVQYALTNGGSQIITSMNRFTIDMSTTAGARLADVRFRAISCYQSRLTNAQLATLTAL